MKGFLVLGVFLGFRYVIDDHDKDWQAIACYILFVYFTIFLFFLDEGRYC